MNAYLSLLLFVSALFNKYAASWNPKHSNINAVRSSSTNLPLEEDIHITPAQEKQLVLLIDVDSTLYSERELTSINNNNIHPWKRGIESQIIRNTHLFGLKYFNLTSHQCDELYRLHGSTVEGIRHMISEVEVGDVLSRFYKEVYDPIDFSCLFTNKGDGYRSGYDHGNALQKRRDLANFLKAICTRHSVYLASNSPRAHVIRVMNAMGLRDVPFVDILAPDSIANQEKLPYPTKSSPFQYYHSIIQRHSLEQSRIFLLDDSLNNIRAAESLGIRGIHIGDNNVYKYSRTLEEGLAEALGHILPVSSQTREDTTSTYTFSDVQYLHAKNKVDFDSINPGVWLQLAKELAVRLQQKKELNIKIADLGAGMLSMLELILLGGGNDGHEKNSLLSLIHADMITRQKTYADSRTLTMHLEYYAYETNTNLLQLLKERLEMLGFEEHVSEDEIIYQRLVALEESSNYAGQSKEPFHSVINVDVTVHLRSVDFVDDADAPCNLDLIIGCCFADLFDPDHLAQSLLRFVNEDYLAPLAYFPITFKGTTQFSPSEPALTSCPSDTTAFRLYSDSLQRYGHNLDPSLLTASIQAYGGSLLAHGQSNWVIDPARDAYLWETMLYFFGMSGGRQILQADLDSVGWINRSRSQKRRIIVSNVDLLYSLSNDFRTKTEQTTSRSTDISIQEIQFIAPYNVTTILKEHHLGPYQVEIESLYSLISSGTELKIFRGDFESAALDVNIKGMADESMEFPLSYGYSLVGRVVACGSDVDHEIIGKLVFVFSPHSSRVVIDADAIQLIPDGIEPEDAIFMPSVETALSLVHDANVRIGENVAVYGQGLIGLLVTSILSIQTINDHSGQFGSVTTFDTIDDRLGVSSIMGATNALNPKYASVTGPFDVSIEVSGNPRALQSAIDNTSNNGRVIVGSWYGKSDVALKLGIDFHRSHKTIQTSQVSNIPCALTGLWSKERRFALTWELLKSIKPSKLITMKSALNDAQHAYELLDKGHEIAVCFKY